MVLKSLPYMGLYKNDLETNRKIVEAELERYKKFQTEAEEKGMELQPCLEGYNFIHKTDKNKNYFMPSRRINAAAIARDLIPIEPLPDGAKPIYDREIDVAAVVTEEDEKDLHASLWTMWIISFTNMAESDKEIKEEIKSLEKLIGTGYYDDEAGDLLMKQVIVYLRSKLAQG